MARRSVRSFKSDPVQEPVIRRLLADAARAPSGGNLQPWHVHAVVGERLAELLAHVAAAGPDPEPAYRIYPENLEEPYRTRRFANGEQLYASIGLPREDRAGRFRQLGRNLQLFGAPVGLFVFIDRNMGRPQWADLGMYLQSLMLLAVEQGLDTCPQEFWAAYANPVSSFLGAPENHMLFCGVALGVGESEAPINSFSTTRAAPEEWLSFHGFGDSGANAPIQ
jgi:nitroreductase